jgi:hypothetical protein
MSSQNLHVPREKLRRETLKLHYAITSLIDRPRGKGAGGR